MPRFVYVDGPRSGMVDFRNLLPGEIPVDDGFYRLTNRTRDGIVEYRWQEPVAPPPPSKTQPKPKPKRGKATDGPASATPGAPAPPVRTPRRLPHK